MEKYQYPADQQGSQRLDAYIALVSDWNRSEAQKLIERELVRVDAKVINDKSYRLTAGQTILITAPNKRRAHGIERLFEDSDVVVFNKPRGVLTHPVSRVDEESTLADELPANQAEVGSIRAGIVHRLDRQTSGVIVTAKNDKAFAYLQKQFARRQVEKWYVAVVSGRLKSKHLKIDMPIIRDESRPQLFKVDPDGKDAQTELWVISEDDVKNLSVVLLKPLTGRTHQLRVHLKEIGNPIIGDSLYGSAKHESPMLLHAYALSVTLPSGKTDSFIAKLPQDMRRYVKDEDISQYLDRIKSPKT